MCDADTSATVVTLHCSCVTHERPSAAGPQHTTDAILIHTTFLNYITPSQCKNKQTPLPVGSQREQRPPTYSPSRVTLSRYDPWNLTFCGEKHQSVDGASCASHRRLDHCNSRQTIMSRMYLFHHCHSPGLRWAISVLNQGSHNWMQIWLSGDSFPSLLQIVKIVC